MADSLEHFSDIHWYLPWFLFCQIHYYV